jgi:hypothetical protein
MPHDAPLPCWRAFHTHKRGNSADEYEDAFAGDPIRGRFAVADGASESSFAAGWAKLLVEGFIAAEREPWNELDWLRPRRQRWADEVDGRQLPWYAEDKREQGAYATLLGIAFRPSSTEVEATAWDAVAVGDSCLFQLRGGELLLSFPLTRSAEFGNLPGLLGSRGRRSDSPQNVVRHAQGQWHPGDRFLLMTDALAEWSLRQTEENAWPTLAIDHLLAEPSPQSAFTGWVEEHRQRHGLRNDDVTLMVIDL